MMQRLARTLARAIAIGSMLFLLFAQKEVPQEDDRYKSEAEVKSELDMKAKLEKQREENEFNKLKERAAKLHQSTGELQGMIEQSSPHIVSIPINKKIAEIEKLLKDIKSQVKF